MKKETKIYLSLVVIILVIIGAILIYKNMNQPVATEDFAKCLSSKSTIYSSSICPHCQDQKKIIGDNYKFLNEVDCYLDPQKCIDANISVTPTWIINGQIIEGVQSIQQLEQISGCQCDLIGNNTNSSTCTTNATITYACAINSTNCTK